MTDINNGVILERLSGRKLSILVSILICLQFAFFLIGAFMFPNVTHTETVEGVMCKDYSRFKQDLLQEKPIFSDLFYLRDYLGRTDSNCERIEADEQRHIIKNIDQDQIVYAFQIPLPRENRVLRLHRWFQTMNAVMQMQVLFPPPADDKEQVEFSEQEMEHEIPLEVKLAYHNANENDDEWHMFANKSKMSKTFSCLKNPYSLDCDMVQLFELSSVHHDFYVVNVKLGQSSHTLIQNSITDKDKQKQPVYTKNELPEIRLMITFIYQTGGFTKLWLIMKAVCCPIVFLILCWFWRRISLLDRKSNLLERMLFSLGIAATLLNLPLEWFTLYFDLPWMLIYTDLRQGIFYSTLFTFWIIFCGEHFMEEKKTSFLSFKSYWKFLTLIWTACICLLAFELCNRGMQLVDPFFSIWDTEAGEHFSMTMFVIACVSCCIYFLLLLYFVYKVLRNFRTKQTQLPAMSRIRRIFYEGIIYRFKFLLLGTVFCAAMTVAFFILNNVNEIHWRFDNTTPTLNYTSGFMTGVYGMWNIYVAAVLIFYAPSHKNKPTTDNARYYQDVNENEGEETMEFANLETKLNEDKTESVLTAFASKISGS